MPGSMGQEGSVGQEGSMGRRVGQEGSMGQSVGQEGSMGESVGQEGSMGRRVGQVQAQLGQGRALAVLTWGELLRALLVLGLCAHPRLQRDPQAFLLLSRRALGRRLWRLLLSVSLWGHFAVGLSPTAVAVLGRRLRARGLRPLLALPLEGDAPHGQGEARLQQNCGAALRCVGLAAAAGPEPAMQLKLTALLDPRLCEKIALRLAEPEGAGLSPEEVAAMLDGQAPALDWLSPDENEALGRGLGRLQRVVQDTESLLGAHLAQVRGAGLRCGVKLVRGAYLAQEQGRARERGRPAPTWDTPEQTSASYERCLALVLAALARPDPGLALMVATHNEESAMAALRGMSRVPPGSVCFGQLRGMGDSLSLALASGGFRVYKSVPVGPPEVTVPYLARRAAENREALGGARREREQLWAELRRRLRPWA
ncbi:hydroxyproline dehydrogenase isoform X4 [Taeniopygia guttata]|uniref:hydroxyproline dehydrogenase isoform X4 n=1 Tax=Taeniopygia guttata TaxID=59729 RepID=UPI003BB8D91C